MPPILEVPVSEALRRHMRRLASANGPTPVDRLDVMRKLMRNVDGATRSGLDPEPLQLIGLAAHALTWANELNR